MNVWAFLFVLDKLVSNKISTKWTLTTKPELVKSTFWEQVRFKMKVSRAYQYLTFGYHAIPQHLIYLFHQLTNKKQERKESWSISQTIQGFEDQVRLIRGFGGNNEFSSDPIRKSCKENDIRLDTRVAREEHISTGKR
jgi:hypothetical protein